jgi:hypothetical protein
MTDMADESSGPADAGILGRPIGSTGPTSQETARWPTKGSLSSELLKEAGHLGGDQLQRIRAVQARKR